MKTNNTKIRGADAIVAALQLEGVSDLFGYPGGAIMPLYDALYDAKELINHVLVRHEQAAVHAAQGYARASGKTGVAIATSGPGATNLMTGLADAMMDSTPIVCITGQVHSAFLGTDAFQETDVMSVSTPITKWNAQVCKAEDIPKVLAKAFYIARTGRPGPVLVDITKDAQMELLDFQYQPCLRLDHYTNKPLCDTNALAQLSAMLDQAAQPLLLVGQGILLSGATAELLAFVEKSGLPVASTILGLSALPVDHPQYIGMLGMHGNYAPNVLTNEADLILAIGMRFDDRVTGRLSDYARNAKVVHIDIDKSELGKNVALSLGIHADAKAALAVLSQRVNKKRYTKWMQRFELLYKEEYQKVVQKDFYPEEKQLRMAEVLHALSAYCSEDTIWVTDVGQHQMLACRYGKFSKPLSLITSGGLGTMGFCVPAAMGAAIAKPESDVIAIVGDGGFQMNSQELATIKQENLGIKILILNNEFLGMVRQWQDMFFEKRYAFTAMENPNFQLLAQSYGIASSMLEHREEMAEELQKMLKTKSSFLLEVKVAKEDNVFPMIPSGSSVSEIRLE